MELQAPKPKRISGDEKRKQEMEALTLRISQYNELFKETRRYYFKTVKDVEDSKQAFQAAARALKIKQEKMQKERAQYLREMKKVSQTTISLERLLDLDDLKTKAKKQKKEQALQKYHDRRGGQRFNIARLDTLPLDVVLYIGEFLMYPVRIQYLEDVYKPYPIFNKLKIETKRMFIRLALPKKKYFSHITDSEEIRIVDEKLRCITQKTINDEVSTLIHTAKQENPEGAYNLIKAMCILFKKNARFKTNWHLFYSTLRQLQLQPQPQRVDGN